MSRTITCNRDTAIGKKCGGIATYQGGNGIYKCNECGRYFRVTARSARKVDPVLLAQAQDTARRIRARKGRM